MCEAQVQTSALHRIGFVGFKHFIFYLIVMLIIFLSYPHATDTVILFGLLLIMVFHVRVAKPSRHLLRRTTRDGDDLTCDKTMLAIDIQSNLELIHLPLTQPPSVEERKATTRATSSGRARRPNGHASHIPCSIAEAGRSGDPFGT